MRIFVPNFFLPKTPNCIFSWKTKSENLETTIVIGKKIDILEVLFPTEIEHKIKGSFQNFKLLFLDYVMFKPTIATHFKYVITQQ